MGSCQQCNFCEPAANEKEQVVEQSLSPKRQSNQNQSNFFSNVSQKNDFRTNESQYVTTDFEKHKPTEDYARIFTTEETKNFQISEAILFNFNHLGPLEIKMHIKNSDYKFIHLFYLFLPNIDQPYLLIESQTIYIGQWKFGKPYGKGIFYFQNGSVYEGWNENAIPTGDGRKFFPEGSYYVGKFKNGKFSGEGKLKKKNGFVYEGHWEDDCPNGNGQELWPNSSLFVGEYVNGKKHGRGRFQWMNGKTKEISESYDGEFKDDLFDGVGTYIWHDGRQYEGTWKQGKMSGKGVFTWKGFHYNRKYEGEYLDDQKHGQGTFFWPDGKSWTGQWIFGKMEGIGTLEKNGKKYLGEWKDGKRIRWLKGNLEQSIKSNYSIGLSVKSERVGTDTNRIDEFN